MLPRHPPPFDAYVAPARRRPQLWRLGVGIALIVAVNFALSAVVFVGLAQTRWGAGLQEEVLGETPAVMVFLLFSFLGLAGGSWAAARLLHGRGLRSLIGHGPTALRHFVAGAGVVGLVHLGALAIVGPGLDLERALAPGLWLMWLPLALLGLAVQTGAEELAFRGYLQQQLAARFASPLVWAGLPSVLFGLLHYDPGTMGANVWLVVGLTGVFGLMAADLTARSGTLGLAWGLHFANNFVALLVISPGGELSGLALFSTPFGPDDTGVMRWLLLGDLLLIGAIWLGCRRVLRRG